MGNWPGIGKALAIMALCAQPVLAATPTPDEMLEAKRWVSAKFDGKELAKGPWIGIVVLANNDPVQANSRNGRPLNISGVPYRNGLYCHAVSKLIVRLPSPCRSFTAICGVDSNEQTSGGRGSVVFSVKANDKEVFNSGLMREGIKGKPVTAGLAGASEFVLDISDGGDGISCDQSDWADAKVDLENGKTINISDLAIKQGKPRRPWTTEPPFSFLYGGRPFSELAGSWNVVREKKNLDPNMVQHNLKWTDPATNFEVECVGVEYLDFPTAEWTLHFKNGGTSESPIIEKIMAIDTTFDREGDREFVLHHFNGSPCTPTDYEPFELGLKPRDVYEVHTEGGRPTNTNLPNFNIEWQNGGVIAAMGWPGQWRATFTRDAEIGLRVQGGQEQTRFKLHAGETARSPLTVVQFYRGDWQRAQNVWRGWMMAHNMPKPFGELPPSHLAACSSHQFGEMIHADEANQKLFIDRYLTEGLKLDYWWMDAGWYVNNGGWPNTGTWEVDRKRFPNGLRAITDHAHEKNVRSIVWFEPERVNPGTYLYEKHPEWLLGKGNGDRLLNLGNPEALQWLINHVNGLIESEGIDLYRNDFNIDPLGFWRDNDADDRQGMTEMKYVEGFLAYWDVLRAKHPNMIIDTCASGGRRNDIETLRRSVPLLRSDFILEPTSQQNHTYGISFWIPFYGTGQNSFDPYVFRSQMTPACNFCFDVRKTDSDYKTLRRLYKQWRDMADLWYGDYWPLTPYSSTNDSWIAWQYDRADLGKGAVLAFRRGDCFYESARFKLRGLDADAKYEVKDEDTGKKKTFLGRDLLDNGLPIAIGNCPGSAFVTYAKIP